MQIQLIKSQVYKFTLRGGFMKKYNKAIGDYGEKIAAEYLKSNGYKILQNLSFYIKGIYFL